METSISGMQQEEEKLSKKESIMSWTRFILAMLAILLFLRFGIGITIINGNSMNPTLESENVVVINKINVNPERGDIVLVRDLNEFDIIKRVIALPNDTIEIKNGVVLLNNAPLNEEYTTGISYDIPKLTIPEGHYFIMGDNRTPGESLDSREINFGPLSEEQIKGEAILSLIPFHTF